MTATLVDGGIAVEVEEFSLRQEIVDGDVSGGTNTSHTIVVSSLAALLDAVPACIG